MIEATAIANFSFVTSVLSRVVKITVCLHAPSPWAAPPAENNYWVITVALTLVLRKTSIDYLYHTL